MQQIAFRHVLSVIFVPVLPANKSRHRVSHRIKTSRSSQPANAVTESLNQAKNVIVEGLKVVKLIPVAILRLVNSLLAQSAMTRMMNVVLAVNFLLPQKYVILPRMQFATPKKHAQAIHQLVRKILLPPMVLNAGPGSFVRPVLVHHETFNVDKPSMEVRALAMIHRAC